MAVNTANTANRRLMNTMEATATLAHTQSPMPAAPNSKHISTPNRAIVSSV